MTDTKKEPCSILIQFSNRPSRDIYGVWESSNEIWSVFLDYARNTSYTFKTSDISSVIMKE